MRKQFSSVAELIDHDICAMLASNEFDDALWLLLCGFVDSPSDLYRYDPPVRVYYASRLLQWEVGNGGFAQAAYNIPDWFDLAAQGYEALKRPQAAQLIREAIKLLPAERDTLKRKGLYTATIGRDFDHFRESRITALDDRIPQDDWEIDDQRVEYVRKHRDAFRKVGTHET